MDDLTPPHWGAPEQHVIEPCPNPWCNSHKTTDAEIRSFEAPIVEPSRSSFEKRVSCPCCPISGPWADTETEAIAAWNIRPLVQQTIAAEREALNGYRAAVAFISAGSWDGCSDCIEILHAARNADLHHDLTDPNDVAENLKRIRLHGAAAIRSLKESDNGAG